MDSITVKLSRPLKLGNGEERNELVFNEATVEDLIMGEEAGASSRTAAVAATLASMAGISFQDFKRLKSRDFTEINKQTVSLVGNVEAPGEAGAS